MACTYNFRNKQFNSELELDSFLLDKYKYIDNYPDLVFSNHNALQIEIKKRLDELKIESQEHWNKYMQWRKEHRYAFNEDGEYEIVKKPYKGVTQYLSEYEIGGKHIHPKFIPENYWGEMKKLWMSGKFGKVEQEIKGYNENDTPLTEDLCTKLAEEIETRWKNLAAIGTAIHNVLQLYFTEIVDPLDNKTKYVFELSDPKKYIVDNIEKENLLYLTINNDKPIDDAINHAKTLHSKLIEEFGNDLLFFPEYLVYQEVLDDKVEKIIGKADLLIIDSRGRTHVLDYKTSIKNYGDFGRTKSLTYKYLMGTYQRMLETHNFNTYQGLLLLAPIKIEGFRKEGDSYTYDGISSDTLIDDISRQQMESIFNNINTFMPVTYDFNITTQDALLEKDKFMKAHFADRPAEHDITVENTKEYLKKSGRLKKDSSGNFNYKTNKVSIVELDEAEFIKKVTEYRKTLPASRIRATSNVKNAIEEAIKLKNPEVVSWPTSFAPKDGESVAWLKETLTPYCNGEWEVYNNPEVEQAMGVIFLKNKKTQTVDIIRISTNYLRINYREHLAKDNPKRDRLSLTGNWETDAQANSKTGTLMMASYSGNIELMELMAFLNNTEGFGEYKIGKMMVVNPYDNDKMEPSNEELLYCFNLLNRFSNMGHNKFENGEILFVNIFEKVLRLYKELMESHDRSQQSKDFFKIFNGCTSVLDDVADDVEIQHKIDALNKLLKVMDNSNIARTGIFDAVYRQQGQLLDDKVRLYNEITLAIAKLKGCRFRQQLEDHGKWFQSTLIFSQGLQGSYIDNPGNLNSETLNLITQLIKEAYQNTRDEVLREKAKLDKLIEDVKTEANFGYVQENIGLNQTELYKDFFDEDAETKGELMFVRPDKLVGAKRKLLEYVLEKINKDRYPKEYEKLYSENDDRYYQVPLAKGSADSSVSARGLLSVLRENLNKFNPLTINQTIQQAAKNIEDKIEGFKEADTKEDKKTFIFKMTNMFDAGNPSITSQDRRLELILKVGIQNLERNVETLTLKHIFAYSQQRNIDTVFPLMKASAIHLQQQGANQNAYFEKDLDYFKDYIWNKVLNKSLIPPELQEIDNVLKYLKLAASKFTLAFSPVQSVYQTIQGLWQNISLIIRKPDGTNAFTFSNFAKAYKIVAKDLLDFSGKPTLCSRLNELFALNDMDMNTYIDRITKNRKGVYNFDNLLFKFASRPDYYNRMVIFLCQMMEEGSFDAISLNSEGHLEYDWTKDKRFSKYASDPTSNSQDPEYQKQKSLYYTIARQFVNEHAKNIDGTKDFVLDMKNPMPLPRPYTSKLVESMKNLADNIYGYYTHENKSLIMSTMIGSMWLQFKTYWSGKKNQYLQGGGVKSQGSWEEFVEVTKDGKEIHWYYRIDDNGEILFNEPPIPDIKPNENYQGVLADTKLKLLAPVIQWKGRWQEGILVSASKVLKDRHVVKNWKELTSDDQDPILRAVFESNMKQLGYDFFMFWIVGSLLGAWLGDWLDELYKDNKKSHNIADGLRVTAAKIAVMSVKNSFADLNFIGSIGNPVGQWTPFAFTWWGNTASRFYNAAIGDTDWWDAAVKSTSVTNQFKPLFDTLKPDLFRTKAEGGTWMSRKAKENLK